MAKPDYSKSLLFDVSLSCESKEVNAAIDELIGLIYLARLEYSAKTPRLPESHKVHLKLIVLNLLRCRSCGSDVYVAYSRNKNVYSCPPRYTPVRFGYRPMMLMTDMLLDLGYAEGCVGVRSALSGKGMTARMKGTSALFDLLDSYKVSDKMIRYNEATETIKLKDKNKKLIDYADTADVRKIRENLIVINKSLCSQFIGLYVPDSKLAAIGEKMKRKGSKSSVIDFSRIKLERIFNDSKFNLGGRFYGGWWQAIPSEERKYIRIDNEPTCEVDYQCYIINLLYSLHKLRLPAGDAYALDGLPADEGRKVVKQLATILLNNDNKKEWMAAFTKHCPRKKYPKVFTDAGVTHKAIVDAFFNKHKSVAKSFGNGYGLYLQYLDSAIAEWVLLKLAGERIVALPIHDSFIVQQKHETRLVEVMQEFPMELWGNMFAVGKEEVVSDIEGSEVDKSLYLGYYKRLDDWRLAHS